MPAVMSGPALLVRSEQLQLSALPCGWWSQPGMEFCTVVSSMGCPFLNHRA